VSENDNTFDFNGCSAISLRNKKGDKSVKITNKLSKCAGVF